MSCDRAVSQFDRAVSQFDRAVSQFDRAVSQYDRAMSQFDRAVSQRDRAMSQFNRAVSQCDRAVSCCGGDGNCLTDPSTPHDNKQYLGIFQLNFSFLFNLFFRTHSRRCINGHLHFVGCSNPLPKCKCQVH